MQDSNAAKLLARVMGWQDQESVLEHVGELQLLAYFKYDYYQRFGPGRRFIESLALWLKQLDAADRDAALQLVKERLVYFSDAEIAHLVETAYPDVIVQERIRLVAEENGIPAYKVGELSAHRRFEELRIKSLYLGLSDGARTNELRRASNHRINNEQIWQAYELGEQKSASMLKGLAEELTRKGFQAHDPRFNLIWLLDDFSGSGNTYIRYDGEEKSYGGKLPKIYKQLHQRNLIDPSHYEVFLVLYIATRQAIDHIEYWCERFTSEHGYKPLQLRVLCRLEKSLALTKDPPEWLASLLGNAKYFDERAHDKHMGVGGSDGRLGFANCALPVVLSHNSPNNSVYLLWGPDQFKYPGLFPRVVRHGDF
ncbi:phosphoribosyltransferase-like protein [Arenimonas oryziterrae]|uniref:PRTase-CE domain-containing protein n=1 Tax=Arenimonas oryziterrae DSM 21050 = YC6267 TaxID=1121015 RepID=A0A091AV90_9GAMM|nr:hypothetical protein [Arenimonas oryziterrae]KFN44208.1 hypothetical protein N789_07260 [Arenimonas oryziterrae DSM 21050 = YC6267]